MLCADLPEREASREEKRGVGRSGEEAAWHWTDKESGLEERPPHPFMCLSFPTCPGLGRQMRSGGAPEGAGCLGWEAGEGHRDDWGQEREGVPAGVQAGGGGAPPPPPPSPPPPLPPPGLPRPGASSRHRRRSRPLPASPPAPPPTPPRPRPSPPRPAAGPAPSPAMKKLWVKKRFQVRAPGAGGAGRGREGRAPRREGGSPRLAPGKGRERCTCPTPARRSRGGGGRPGLRAGCAGPSLR